MTLLSSSPMVLTGWGTLLTTWTFSSPWRQKETASIMPVSCLAYSLTLNVEATCSSETSVDFQQATWCYIPQDRTLHNHRCVLVHVGKVLQICTLTDLHVACSCLCFYYR
jgi:hypothetical protein